MCDEGYGNSVFKWKICRVCLSTNVKLYNMKKFNLLKDYELLTGIHTNQVESVDHCICWECAARLTSAIRLRDTAVRSHALLLSLIESPDIDPKDLLSIDRQKSNLTSCLTHKIYEVNYADYHFIHTELEVQKIENTENLIEIDVSGIKLEVDDINDNFDTSSDEDLIDVKRKEQLKANKDVKNNLEEVNKVTIVIPSFSNSYLDPEKVGRNSNSNLEEVGKVDILDKVGVEKKARKVNKIRKLANAVVLDVNIFDVTNLSYEEQIGEIQKRLDSNNYKNSEFKCDKCYKGFVDADAYKFHMNRHSDRSGTHECNICKMRFKKRHAMLNHVTSHEQKFICKQCEFVTTRRYAAKLHEEFHKGKNYQCPHCSEKFSKRSTFMSHVRIKHPSDCVCALCGYSFLSDKGLALHKKLKHRFDEQQVPPDGPICQLCDVQFINKEVFETHMKLSAKHKLERESNGDSIRNCSNSNAKKLKTGESNSKCKPLQPLNCEVCDTQLPDSSAYYRHFRREHPGMTRTKYAPKSRHMCEVCGRFFQSVALLQDHSSVHSEMKQFSCGICDKRFQRKYRLEAHVRRHAVRRPHPCALCGGIFSNRSNLNRHMRNHTGIKPYPCEMCNKQFKTPSEKKSHVTYVHLKKPWPKRNRRKTKTDKQSATQPELAADSDVQQAVWPESDEPKITSTTY